MSKDARNEDLDPTPEVQAKFNELVALPAARLWRLYFGATFRYHASRE